MRRKERVSGQRNGLSQPRRGAGSPRGRCGWPRLGRGGHRGREALRRKIEEGCEGLRRKEGFLRADWSLGAWWMDGCRAGDAVREEGGGKLTDALSRRRWHAKAKRNREQVTSKLLSKSEVSAAAHRGQAR